MIQNYINHITFVIDRSGSMGHLTEEVVTVFDKQIKNLAIRSEELRQETRVSVFLFDDKFECLIYDMDVMRLPSLARHYTVRGSTALIDATLKTINDLRQIPELYADHSHLCYILSDGYENASKNKPEKLKQIIHDLPDNWTLALMVPDQTGVFEGKKLGFSPNNIQVWSTNASGINEVGNIITKATNNFMQARSTGTRSTKSLFTLDASNLNTKIVSQNLEELKPSEYLLLNVYQDSVIKPFVESWTKKDYRVGSAYYQITKPETIQNYKQVVIQNKKNGKVYSGQNARQLLNLPDYTTKVNPGNFGEFSVFLQSSSVNRKLVAGTQVIIIH